MLLLSSTGVAFTHNAPHHSGKLRRAAPPCHIRLCAPPPSAEPFRVCTFGGEGGCSYGMGDKTLDAMRFLMPLDGPEVVGCSCLARCDRAVAVRRPDHQLA